jgi:hypothetical protein
MKFDYIKPNINRKKEFAIITKIANSSAEGKFIVKESVFPEGISHITAINRNRDKLAKVFPGVKINKTWIKNGKLYCEFIEGVSLRSYYIKAFKENNRSKFFELFDWHKDLACGIDNLCEFESTAEFRQIFGDAKPFIGQKALRYMNFDSMADNILIKGGDFSKPYFIDYEWVFDFPVPIALLYVHLVNSLYCNIRDLGNFITSLELLEHLCISEEAVKSKSLWQKFVEYTGISSDEDYLLRYKRNERPFSSMIFELETNLDWHKDYLQKQQKHIEYQDQRIAELDRIESHVLGRIVNQLYGREKKYNEGN